MRQIARIQRHLWQSYYEAVEVLSSIPNLKQWLRLRDRHAAFDDAKAQGYAGFPALLLDDDRVILDESKLKEIF